MRVFTDPAAFQRACLQARAQGDLGFVPTMGYLHAGHAELLRRARAHRTSALSIFVNPTQFGPREDLSRYPRDLPRDLALAEAQGVDLVFAPTSPEQMYPPGFDAFVEVGGCARPLEGESRPGHFRGVATVVLKLFQLAQPTHAYFGQKDFQQLAVVGRMATDLNVPVAVVGVPTVREPDGLALSSRNVYLSPEDRQRALCLWGAIRAVQEAVDAGERSVATLTVLARAVVDQGSDRVDYVTIRDRLGFDPLDTVIPGETVLLIAARVGQTRLIDNHVLGTPLPPPAPGRSPVG